jgi:hypothetical protein
MAGVMPDDEEHHDENTANRDKDHRHPERTGEDRRDHPAISGNNAQKEYDR